MSIPVKNIYYLLLYAWGQFKPGALAAASVDDSPNLPNLLSKVLLIEVQRILRRGLDRGYLGQVEETRSPRGRLLFNEMVKRQSLLRGVAVCDIDEFTSNILHNQILKTTLIRLAASPEVNSDLKHALFSITKRMAEVETIRLTPSDFIRIQLSRNNAHYRLAIRVCELLFCLQLPDSDGSGPRFRNLLDDEQRMRAIFEDFLRNFYRIELAGFSSASEIMTWAATAMHAPDLDLLPVMKTDITLRSGSRTIIADAKYYREALAGGRFNPKIQSPHLYQLSTYLAHEKLRNAGQPISGILIYPATRDRMRYRYQLLGFNILVTSVNLAVDWQSIHAELIDIVQ